MPPSLASTSGMANKDRSFHEPPQEAGGEGWLYSEQQQKLCHFKPDTATVHAQWVAIRTYSYVPPRPPERMALGADQSAVSHPPGHYYRR